MMNGVKSLDLESTRAAVFSSSTSQRTAELNALNRQINDNGKNSYFKLQIQKR